MDAAQGLGADEPRSQAWTFGPRSLSDRGCGHRDHPAAGRLGRWRSRLTYAVERLLGPGCLAGDAAARIENRMRSEPTPGAAPSTAPRSCPSQNRYGELSGFGLDRAS